MTIPVHPKLFCQEPMQLVTCQSEMWDSTKTSALFSHESKGNKLQQVLKTAIV